MDMNEVTNANVEQATTVNEADQSSTIKINTTEAVISDSSVSITEPVKTSTDIETVVGVEVLDETNTSLSNEDKEIVKNMPPLGTPVETTEESEEIEEETPVIEKSGSFAIDDEDLSLLDDDDSEEDSKANEEAKKKRLEEFKEDFKKNFAPVNDKVNLSEFTISKKSVGISKVINHIQKVEANTACSPLYNENRVIKMTGFSSLELNRMDPQRIRQENYLNFMLTKFRTIYDHIVDPNKPATFEGWLKNNNTSTVNDYFFAGYKATFMDSNILTYSCPECENAFLKKFDIDDMIKFKSPEVKDKYYNILHSGNMSVDQDTIVNGMYQATDDYVFELRRPTLYSTYMEPTMLDDKIATKYDDLLTLISYIENAYVIDRKEKILRPIDMKPDATNPINTIKRKIKALAIIIKSFSSDQLQAFSTETNKYDFEQTDENGEPIKNDITYIIPACNCPKCNTVIPEQEQLPENMCFLRHQLGAFTRM